MPKLSDTAMVLAAGLGQRMRPLTLTKPKPLFEIGGHTMLDLALDKLAAVGIKRTVVNTHYLAEQIEEHLQTRRDIEIVISHESVLLDTGGGIKNALSYFDGLPFLALNADLPWQDKDEPSLSRMVEAWNPELMDVLLLLMPTRKARGFDPKGDFTLEPDGRAHRQNLPYPLPYVMLSAQIAQPRLFARQPDAIFSNNRIWDEAEAASRLYGIKHRGACYHVGTPETWRTANELLANGQGWDMA